MTRAINETNQINNEISHPKDLPILAYRELIVETIKKNQVCVITGATGSGKTTQLPRMCLEAARGLKGIIGCTQPRRLAAVMAARRIAEELGEQLGQTVGYKIRFDSRGGPRQKIKIMTDGILLMEMQSDPQLRLYDTLIIDEAHERSLNIDLILGMLKTIIPVRPELKVIVTSATIDAQKFSAYLGNAPIIEVSGTLYPVVTFYRPLPPTEIDREVFTHVELAAEVVEEIIHTMPPGDILIFMPTEADIRETANLLKGRYGDDVAVLPLYARLSRADQELVFRRLTRRKIVIATNIAETSLTIPDIRYVIDSGLARTKIYNPRTKITGLPVQFISQASALQRQGRAGRVQAGVCYRLYSVDDYEQMSPYMQPEVVRANLAEVILKMLSLEMGNIVHFPFLDRPNYRSIQDGIDTLFELGAVEVAQKDALEAGTAEEGKGPFRLTSSGRVMARLPLDPRLAKMLIEADRQGCLQEVTIIAAALTIQDPREQPLEKKAEVAEAQQVFKHGESDFMCFLNIWKEYQTHSSISSKTGLKRYCRHHFLSFRRMKEWQDIYEQLSQILQENGFKMKKTQWEGEELYEKVHKAIVRGYLSQIGVKKEKRLYTMAKGREVMIFPTSELFNKGGKWIVAAELVETTRLYARITARIESHWLLELAPHLCRYTYQNPRWDDKRQEVVADEQVSLFGLIIIPRRTVSYGPANPKEATEIFIREVLLAEETELSFPFLVHNRQLIDRIKSWEARVRRRDLLVSSEKMVEFYVQRLPAVYSLRTLKRLISRQGDDFLKMTDSDLLIQMPDPEELARYPDSIELGTDRIQVQYVFDPGHQHDGATLKIPLALLSQLNHPIAETTIPGIIEEKAWRLLKGLPKEYRKRLQPLKETYRLIREALPLEQGDLPDILSALIKKRFGIEIAPTAWPINSLEEHLRLRFAVVDEKGSELGSGRDLATLKKEILFTSDNDYLKQAKEVWERVGLTNWDIPDLPKSIPLIRADIVIGHAYPALFSENDTVGVRLFFNSREALLSHLQGVATLYRLYLQHDFRLLKKYLRLTEQMKVWLTGLYSEAQLLKDIEKRVAQELFSLDIRNGEDFIRHAAELRSQILPTGQRIFEALIPLLKIHWETIHTLEELKKTHAQIKPALSFLVELEEEVRELLPPDFLSVYGAEKFGSLIRYLKAMVIRARRGLFNLVKAEVKNKLVKAYHQRWKLLRDQVSAHTHEGKRLAVDELFWMIEEFKISLFAQEMKTLFPISEKRLEEKIMEIMGMDDREGE